MIPHSGFGLLSMAAVGVRTTGSQFYISLNPEGTPHLNGRCVVFGRVVGGEAVLTAIQNVFTFRNQPSSEISITACGVDLKQ